MVAGALGAIYPMLFLADATLMSESLFVFLVAAALLLAYAAADRPGPLRFVALGVVLGLATLTRAEAIVLAVFLVIPLAWRLRDASVWRRVGLGVLVFAVAAIIVVPWSVRNARTFHEFVPVSNSLVQIVDGANCRLTYSGPVPRLVALDVRQRRRARDRVLRGVQRQQARLRRSEGRRRLAPRRAQLHPVARKRPPEGRGGALPPHVRALPACAADPARGARGTAAGLGTSRDRDVLGARTARDRRLRGARAAAGPVWPLAAAVLTVAVSTVLTYGTQRFRITAEPAILVLAATIDGSARRFTPAAGRIPITSGAGVVRPR